MNDVLRRLAAILLLGALGCNDPIPVFESLVPSDEPALSGRILTPDGAPSGPVRAAVLWNHYGEAGAAEEIAGQGAAVGSGFPAAFSLTIDAPPVEVILAGALVTPGTGEPRIGYGLIVALTDDAGPEASPFERVVGGATGHVVVYAEADLPPQTEMNLLLHGRLAEGFHLLRVIRPDSGCYGTEDDLRCPGFRVEPAPDGFATTVDIEVSTRAVIGLASL